MATHRTGTKMYYIALIYSTNVEDKETYSPIYSEIYKKAIIHLGQEPKALSALIYSDEGTAIVLKRKSLEVRYPQLKLADS